MRRIYLDHAATTPLDPAVFEAMRPYFTEKFGNASSVHDFGRQTRAALDESRETIARLLGAKPSEILFTSGGTESNNFALKGIAARMRLRGKNHLITSAAEHHAVLETCTFLGNNGCACTYLPVTGEGIPDPGALRKAIRPETGLISLMHANNETGSVSPLEEIAVIARGHGIPLHSDLVQSFGKIPVDVERMEIDLGSLSAHKIYGPKGIGALYIRRGTDIEQLLHGGGQERGRRAGTENVPLAVGFAAAATLICRDREEEQARLRRLRTMFLQKLTAAFPGLLVNGQPDAGIAGIISVSFPPERFPVDGDSLLFRLDLAGVAAASGSACTSGSLSPSHVLLAMGRDTPTARATIRFSPGRMTTEEDIGETVSRLGEIIRRPV